MVAQTAVSVAVGLACALRATCPLLLTIDSITYFSVMKQLLHSLSAKVDSRICTDPRTRNLKGLCDN